MSVSNRPTNVGHPSFYYGIVYMKPQFTFFLFFEYFVVCVEILGGL